MLHIHYVKTPAGRAEMDARTGSLTSRERQIMLLCSGQRPLTVLMEVFGHSVVRELHELAARGLVQAHRQPPEAVPPPAPAPAAEATSTAAAQRLLQAREFAGLAAGSVGGAAAQALVARQSTITQPADILSYRKMRLSFCLRLRRKTTCHVWKTNWADWTEARCCWFMTKNREQVTSSCQIL